MKAPVSFQNLGSVRLEEKAFTYFFAVAIRLELCVHFLNDEPNLALLPERQQEMATIKHTGADVSTVVSTGYDAPYKARPNSLLDSARLSSTQPYLLALSNLAISVLFPTK